MGDTEAKPAAPAKRLYFELPPELGDGQSATVTRDTALVAEAVRLWCEELLAVEGAELAPIKINTVWLSDAEYAALPEN